MQLHQTVNQGLCCRRTSGHIDINWHDPIATAKVEELIYELRGRFAIAIVTHNMQQAARVSQRTAFFHLGELVEYGRTEDIFTNPVQERTRDYITGRYG